MTERRRVAAGAQELTFLDADVTTEHARVRHRFTQKSGRSSGHASLLWPLLEHALAWAAVPAERLAGLHLAPGRRRRALYQMVMVLPW